MLALTGNNLPQRQHQLNKNVNKAISNKVNFDDIRLLEEVSDVDRLFKIDVASKHRNTEYILETLKCGDSLYISRALKCEWLYGDDYSHIINPDYLQDNVIPWMSIKMKKKFLTTISNHVRNEERMLNFYKYCKETKLKENAFKFLIFTCETNKIEYLQNKTEIYKWDMKKIFANSFSLVEWYLGKLRSNQKPVNDKIVQLRYLYSVSDEKYLNLLERYSQGTSTQLLGLRLSKNIMTKNKERVLKYSAIYITYLNMDIIVKYSTVEEAKQYAVILLPCTVHCFWSMNFYESYKKILNLLPANEIYQFLREIFMRTYTNEPFEMSVNFYNQKYYQLLTVEERELWALKHLNEKKELLGVDEDFQWYQFVNFDLAFKEIKKYIYKTVDKRKRCEIVNVLVYSVRNEQQLETLINYYYERHVNEVESIKQTFIDKVIELHNIFKFNESCWNAFNKILHSMKSFKEPYLNSNKALAFIYYLIHNKDIPEYLLINKITEYEIQCYFESCFRYLTEKQIKLIYEYFINLFTNIIIELDKENDMDKNNDKICFNIDSILEVLIYFKKTKHDCPDIVYKYVKLNWDRFQDIKLFEKAEDKHSESSLIRLLKQDKTILLETLPHVIDSFKHGQNFLRLNNLFKKLRIYFSNDIAKKIMNIFETYLSAKSLSHERYIAFTAINGIFNIADDDYKRNFMTKYAPTEPKISHDTIDQNILIIQEGICQLACYSRPPIPSPVLLQYIKGDYVKYCLPMLNSCITNLPIAISLELITAILDAPVSLQKHGIRLAFQWFKAEELKKLIVNVWKKSKNISLRKLLYIHVFNYIKAVDSNLQQSFYDVLKFFTTDLHEDDDDEVFGLIRYSIPEAFRGDLLETAWKTVENFPDQNSKNIFRKIIIISEIESHIDYVSKEFCRVHILDSLIDSTLFEENIKMADNYYNSVIHQKWKLAIKYITHFDNDKEMDRCIEFVSIIIKSCIEKSEKYDVKFTMYHFLNTILEKLLLESRLYKSGATPVLKHILNLLLDLIPIHEMYILYWNYSVTLKLTTVIDFYQTVDSVTGKKTYVYMNTNDIATRFTNELSLFINHLKEKNILYTTCFNEIVKNFPNIVGAIMQSFDYNIGDLIFPIIDSLTVIQTPETFLLAVLLFFERHPNRDCYKYLSLIYDKVIEFGNEEVTAVMYDRFLTKSRNYF